MDPKFLNKVATMPPLVHNPAKGTADLFDINASEVAKWLLAQSEVKQWIVEQARNYGAIEYNPETNTWRGTGRRFEDPFTEAEIMSCLGPRPMRLIDVMAACTEKTGRQAAKVALSLSLKKMAAGGRLGYDERLKAYYRV